MLLLGGEEKFKKKSQLNMYVVALFQKNSTKVSVKVLDEKFQKKSFPSTKM